MAASTRSKALSLYKGLIRESGKFKSYNFRVYAVEKTKHDFRANKELTDSGQIAALLKKAQDNLDIVKRQVLIGQMYGEGHLVIEHQHDQQQNDKQ